MANFFPHKIGIYEKALPACASWLERFAQAKKLGFDYLEISIDETPQRQARLHWSKAEKMAFIEAKLGSGIDVPSMCLSAHRGYPFGSQDPQKAKRAKTLMQEAIAFAVDVGIRNIQLAGYDVYYEPANRKTRQDFITGLQWAVAEAAKSQIMLSVEIMDSVFMSSITRWLELEAVIANPWFAVYPDVGNLSAWGADIDNELTKGIHKVTAIHLKDTLAVTPTTLGQFRDVPFGQGCVDFAFLFHTLRKLNYQGAFLIEMWAKEDGEDIARIAGAKQWLIEQFNKGV